MPRPKAKIIGGILGNPVYAIWRARNEAVWHKKVTIVQRVVETVKQDSKLKL